MTDLDLGDVMRAPKPRPMSGNTPWASDYAIKDMRRVAVEQAAQAPRSLQRHLGPSELGHECDRQVVAKMAGVPGTNHLLDPWASIVGTAIHAWLADAFEGDNARSGTPRWLTEYRVTPAPLVNNPGTGDLYDVQTRAVVDHKCQGDSVRAKLRRDGPSLHYRVQLKLYGLGFRALGLPVERVVLASWPRTKSTLDDLYVWEEPFVEDDPELAWVFKKTPEREALAQMVAAGQLDINQVKATPSDADCIWCPIYRPQAADGVTPGCPGMKGKRP